VPSNIALKDTCSMTGYNTATDNGYNSGSGGTSHTTALTPTNAPVPTGAIALSVDSDSGRVLGASAMNAVILFTSSGSEVHRYQPVSANPMYFNSVAYGSYYIDVYCWDQLVRQTPTFLHDAPVTSVTATTVPKRPLQVAVYYTGGTIPFSGATVYLDSWNGQTQTWSSNRVNAVTDTNGQVIFSAWPTDTKYQLRVVYGTSQVGLVGGVTVPNNASGTSYSVTTSTPIRVSTITGRVLGVNNSPLAGAHVCIETTPFATDTASDGTFMLAGVIIGHGYVLDISATGYASVRIMNVNVASTNNDLGDIPLAQSLGTYVLEPLTPDVNPAITTIEAGGTAYRYYSVVTSAGGQAGGIAVTVQLSGGSVITQSNLAVPNSWLGQVAGVSDANGVICIAIPAALLNSSGALQTVHLIISNVVLQTFQTQVVQRRYDQVWKQSVGGGVGFDIEALNGEIDSSAESQLRHEIVGGINTSETISRSREQKFSVGIGGGFDVGASLKVSNIDVQGSGGVSGGFGAFAAVLLNSQFSFVPNTTDQNQNLMKLYVDLGNVMSGVPIANQLYTYVDGAVVPMLLATNLDSVECDVQVGAYTQGQIGIEIANNQQDRQIGFGGQVSGDLEDIVGYEATFGIKNNAAVIYGIGGNVSAVAGVGFSDASSTAGEFSSVGLGGEQDQLSWSQTQQVGFVQPQQITKMKANAGTPNPFPAWQQYDPRWLNADYAREFTETWVQTGNGSLTNYERSVFASEVGAQVGINFDVLTSLNFNVELDRGAEAVNERGAVLQRYQFSHWPSESYPAITTDFFPTQTWPSILAQWEYNAVGPISQAINQTITAVANVGNTIVQAGQATLNIAEGTLNADAHIVSSWASDLSHLSLVIPAGQVHALGSPLVNVANYLPPDGSTNYVYGIGGVYRFASTNALNGTATLTIAYSPADITGLDPAELQIYQLPDGTNRWQLIGGVADTVSNTVTATISNFGTYAIAPFLPTGHLQLIPSTNALPADGVSTMTVIVTNLMLNNGNIATQQWLFTANATGVQILNQDCDTNLPGTQVISSNATVTLSLQAPLRGSVGHVALASVAGDAVGTIAINLINNIPPATPTNIVLSAGQSRIWVSWRTNSEPDLAGYRVYYSAGVSGPPWNGTAAIEGTPSPVQVTGTNVLLRGLALGTGYFVAVSAVDTSGNESPLSQVFQVTTTNCPPAPPTAVAVRFRPDGTNIIMWGLSEDDGYNDRDVVQYDIYRAVLPGGSYTNVAVVSAGIGVYRESTIEVASGHYISYAVSALNNIGQNSSQTVANDATPPPAPVISVIPNSGTVGTSIMITGLNFSNVVVVAFNGTSATNFTVMSATQIGAVVPVGATAGAITVTTPGGTATSATTFTITPLTTITNYAITLSASPANGGIVSGGGIFAVGSTNTVTATASSGFKFIDWSGDATGTNNPLTVTMNTNLNITANFAPASTNFTVTVITNGDGSVLPILNGFLPVKGIYNGLFFATIGVTEQTAGMLKGLTISQKGKYTGTLLINGRCYAISGSFNVDGQATNNIKRPAGQGGLLTLEMILLSSSNSAPQVTGTVSGTTNGIPWEANLTAYLATNTVPSAEYTMLILPDANSAPTNSPGGDGYALITNHLGKATITGALADGTAFSQSVPVSQDGYVPIYANLYAGKGLLLGWISLNITNSFGVGLTWIHPARTTGLYENGFTNDLLAHEIPLSPWTNPPANIFAATNLSILDTISDTNALMDCTVTVSNNYKLGDVSGPTPLNGCINPKTGLLKVTIGSGANKWTCCGTILLNATNGGGYFVTKTNAGAVKLEP
jgi:hypothetical protein